MNSNIDEAIAAIKGGDKETGRKLLLKLLESNPQNEQAWLWLASTVNGERKKYCLEKVLRLNPRNDLAKQELEKVKEGEKPRYFPRPQPTSEPTVVGVENKETPTKQCPYCAETIKAQAVVCRFCGRELGTSAHLDSLRSEQEALAEDRRLIEDYVRERTAQGWQVISRTDNSVQLRKPKQMSGCLVILGVVLLVAFGAGLIVLGLAVVDYMSQKEQVIFVTADDIRRERDARQVAKVRHTSLRDPNAKSSNVNWDAVFIILVVLIIAVLVAVSI